MKLTAEELEMMAVEMADKVKRRGSEDMSYLLTIKNDRVQISRSHRDASPHIVKSVADYNDYFAKEAKQLGFPSTLLDIMASSSMDFPEEFTSDPATIALARALRPGGFVGAVEAWAGKGAM